VGFTGKEPLRETVLNPCKEKPKLLQRQKIYDRVVAKLLEIIQRFDDDLGNIVEETIDNL
jgi:type I restriction enzyme R subunit